MTRLTRRMLMASCASVAVALGEGTWGANADKSKVGRMELKPGQLWRYQTRPQEPKSRILIQRVEENPKLGQIVHIRVTNLVFKGPKGNVGMLPHLPFSGDALKKCLVALESSQNEVPPDYLEGYKAWREAFDAGKGGVFTLDVAAVLDTMEKGFAK